jgi:peptide/nickel transport system permease protein
MSHRRKIATYGIAFVIILVLNFLLPRMMAGDPFTAIYGDEAMLAMTADLKASLIERFALDQSLWQQFGAYISGLLQGDMGYSYYYKTQVFDVIMGSLPWTLLIVGTSLILSTFLGIVLGIESGWRRGEKIDRALLVGLMSLNGFPDFFLGLLLLIIFGVSLGLFPLSGAMTPYSGLSGMALFFDVIKHMILPVTALTLAHLSAGYLLTRNTMLSVLKAPFMLTGRAKGLPTKIIKYRYAGRNSMLPVITMTGIWLGRLGNGALFV